MTDWNTNKYNLQNTDSDYRYKFFQFQCRIIITENTIIVIHISFILKLIQFPSILCFYDFIISDETSNESFIMNQSHQLEACSSSSSSMTTNVMNKKKKANHCESRISDGIVVLFIIFIRYKLIIIFRSLEIKSININNSG